MHPIFNNPFHGVVSSHNPFASTAVHTFQDYLQQRGTRKAQLPPKQAITKEVSQPLSMLWFYNLETDDDYRHSNHAFKQKYECSPKEGKARLPLIQSLCEPSSRIETTSSHSAQASGVMLNHSRSSNRSRSPSHKTQTSIKRRAQSRKTARQSSTERSSLAGTYGEGDDSRDGSYRRGDDH